MGTQALFEVRGGINVAGAHLISGDGVPGGSGGRPDEAVKGSIYLDTTNGNFWIKKQDGAGTAKWSRVQNQDDMNAAMLGLSWREPVRLYDHTVYADLTAAEAAVNGGTIDGQPVAEGDRILFDNIDGVAKNAYLVTGAPGSGATLVEDGNQASKGDALFIQDGTEAGSQFVYSGSGWVLQGKASATEIAAIRAFIGKGSDGNVMPSYGSEQVVTDGQALDVAISNLDAEIGAAVAAPQSRTIGTISDQAINRNLEALDDAIGADPTGHYLSAGFTINQNLSALDAILTDGRYETGLDGVTTLQILDAVKVDEVAAAQWMIHARLVSNPSHVLTAVCHALHNGTVAADATKTKDTLYAKMDIDGGFGGFDAVVDLSGSGVSQVMRLGVTCDHAIDVRAVRYVLNQP